jgi:hypothetical protein
VASMRGKVCAPLREANTTVKKAMYRHTIVNQISKTIKHFSLVNHFFLLRAPQFLKIHPA